MPRLLGLLLLLVGLVTARWMLAPAAQPLTPPAAVAPAHKSAAGKPPAIPRPATAPEAARGGAMPSEQAWNAG